ncbi:hypothetical protein A3Q56_08085 [Intoshia linei]|uniref:Uncharacterized protein n=1 Tax=Intoshia linei TaxID=1819745 RepID=A0A177ASJ6_9BILA|nr:hypothetical protein A3Q56_08085 [Intoshia linei]
MTKRKVNAGCIDQLAPCFIKIYTNSYYIKQDSLPNYLDADSWVEFNRLKVPYRSLDVENDRIKEAIIGHEIKAFWIYCNR